MKAKRCPLCENEVRLVHYAIPEIYFPAGWEDSGYDPNDPDYIRSEPMITYKRVECISCGATSPHLSVQCDQAIEQWNAIDEKDGHRHVIQKWHDEVLQMEESEDI